MALKQRVEELEKEIETIKHNIDVNYDDIEQILKYLSKKYPKDFVGRKKFKPRATV